MPVVARSETGHSRWPHRLINLKASGSVLAFSAVVAASLAQRPDWENAKYPGLDLPLIVPILAALAVGALCGLINGSLVARFKIPPFIATLGMFTVARGAALLYSERPVSGLTDAYNYIGQGEILKVLPIPDQPPLGLPVPVIILVLCGRRRAHYAQQHPLWPAYLCGWRQ